MQIETLRCFLELAYYLNYSLAAESLYISQSAMSKRILSMEKELNVKLFERTARTVKLTAVGERILYQIEKVVNDYDEMLSGLPDSLGERNTTLLVSSMCDMSQYGITKMIIEFEKTHNAVIAETREQSHASMMDHLANKHIVCAIGYQELFTNMKDYNMFFLKKDPLVMVYSKGHPLAKKQQPNLGNAKFYRFCFPKEDRQFFELVLRLCTRVGFSPELTKSDVRISTIKEYISQGMRVTITTMSRAKTLFTQSDFVVTPLPDEDKLHLVLLVRKDAREEIYNEFVRYAIQYYSKEESNYSKLE